jgi:hypothetical protein
MITLPLTRGLVALIDDIDEHLTVYKWRPRVGGVALLYARRNVRVGGSRVEVSLHREIMCAAPDQVVDHINGNGLDNRRGNLRLCTRAGNARNLTRKQAGTSSHFKGVCWHSRDRKWVAMIKAPGLKSQKSLGYFALEIEAARAYDAAAVMYFGDFAATNAKAGRY